MFFFLQSVVSASSEPDTIKLLVNIEDNSLNKQRSIKCIDIKQLGAKKKIIKLSDSGGTYEEDLTDNQNCCVSDDEINKLGNIALKVCVYVYNRLINLMNN